MSNMKQVWEAVNEICTLCDGHMLGECATCLVQVKIDDKKITVKGQSGEIIMVDDERLSAYETHKLIKEALPDCETYWEKNEKVRQMEFNWN